MYIQARKKSRGIHIYHCKNKTVVLVNLLFGFYNYYSSYTNSKNLVLVKLVSSLKHQLSLHESFSVLH